MIDGAKTFVTTAHGGAVFFLVVRARGGSQTGAAASQRERWCVLQRTCAATLRDVMKLEHTVVMRVISTL